MAGSGQADRYLDALVRVLVDEHGYAAVVKAAQKAAGDNAPTPPCRPRTISHTEAVRRAAALVPPDELARYKARRGK